MSRFAGAQPCSLAEKTNADCAVYDHEGSRRSRLMQIALKRRGSNAASAAQKYNGGTLKVGCCPPRLPWQPPSWRRVALTAPRQGACAARPDAARHGLAGAGAAFAATVAACWAPYKVGSRGRRTGAHAGAWARGSILSRRGKAIRTRCRQSERARRVAHGATSKRRRRHVGLPLG